jgi:hypothetical protein
LRYAITADVAHWIHTWWASTAWKPVGSSDRLTAYDQNLQPQPMLAETWDFSPDYPLQAQPS